MAYSDEQRAACLVCGLVHCNPEPVVLEAANVRRELAEAQRDAARYRWMRENDCTDKYSTYWECRLNDAESYWQLDHVIDAEMATPSPSTPAEVPK